MKRFFSIMVVAIALVMASFTTLSKTTALECDGPIYTFVYDGSGSEFDVTNYVYEPDFSPATCPNGFLTVCVISVCVEFVDLHVNADPTLKVAPLAEDGTLYTAINAAKSGSQHTISDPSSPSLWEIVLKFTE